MILYLDVFVPPFGLLLLGALLRRHLLRDDQVWAGIERLVFWVLMPALLCSAIAAVDLATLPIGGMAIAIWLALLGGAGLSLALAGVAGIDHPARTSVFQGGVRFNNLMGFAVMAGLFGAAGTSLGAVATGLIVPFVQLMTTLVFALGGGRGFSPGRAARQLALNPLLLACLAGFAVSLPAGCQRAWRAGPGARPASVALGLLCVGAALSLGARCGTGCGCNWRPAASSWCWCRPWCCARPGPEAGTAGALGALVFMALPTATTSYVMAAPWAATPR